MNKGYWFTEVARIDGHNNQLWLLGNLLLVNSNQQLLPVQYATTEQAKEAKA